MRVLVACEESQAVCKEFRNLGHEAYSCDTQECSGGHPEWHIQDDALKVINREKWDMIIAFPPCTDLSAAGAPSWKQKQADGRQQVAIDFVYAIRDADCDLIAIENPTGKLNTSWRKPDQIINPFQFGDPFKKRTCLWLKGLPKLEDTNVVEPKYHYTSNSTRGGLLKDGTRKKSELPIYKAWDSPKERSKTFPGIAKAMAEQWGSI
ncbi:S-adenosyl-L-methionine-dependent methyltransferase [Vibrio phage 1.223.O._10N.261.48.A9]|nr:S-adenosyl-L-methionine-dependent methyltransferase [Vibrio phage 1.223.O._10N.261.48.A9]